MYSHGDVYDDDVMHDDMMTMRLRYDGDVAAVLLYTRMRSLWYIGEAHSEPCSLTYCCKEALVAAMVSADSITCFSSPSWGGADSAGP